MVSGKKSLNLTENMACQAAERTQAWFALTGNHMSKDYRSEVRASGIHDARLWARSLVERDAGEDQCAMQRDEHPGPDGQFPAQGRSLVNHHGPGPMPEPPRWNAQLF
jgi:hypothetical protein